MTCATIVQYMNISGTPVFSLPALTPTQRKVYGAVFSKRRGAWLYPAFAPFHAKVKHDIDMLFPDAEWSDEARAQLASQDAVEDRVAENDLDGYTPLYKNYAHQNEALSRAIWYLRFGLFLGRGLGKTKIAVDTLRYLKNKNPRSRALILALKVNLYTWVNETEKFTNGELRAEPLIAKGPKKRLEALKEYAKNPPDALVITYDTARVAWKEIQAHWKYSVIIADESHKLRGHRSQQTQAVIELSKRAPKRLILTGTPSLGNPMHLWGQLKMLGGFIVPNSWEFSKRHLMKSAYNQHVVVGYKNMSRLNKLVTSVSLHRDAEECLDMPDRVFQHIKVAPTPSQKRAYNTLVTSGRVSVKGTKVVADEPIVRITKLSQVSSGFLYNSFKDPTACDGCPHMRGCVENSISPYTSKCKVYPTDPGGETLWIRGGSPTIEAAFSCVEELLSEGKKVVVWAKHRAVLGALYAKLSEIKPEQGYPLKVLRYDSTTEHPHLAEKEFNTSKTANVIVAQITMGIGVTFNAPAMIYAEVPFALDSWLQSLDRNWGIRAKGHDQLLVQTITVSGSIFDSTLGLLTAKIDVAAAMAKKPVCVGCSKAEECALAKIEPFKPGCKHENNPTRVKVSMETLK